MSGRTIGAKKTPERSSYYEKVKVKDLFPLWEVFTKIMSPQPQVKSRPKIWCYKDIRDDLMEAASLISTEEAERRVLYLENPGLPDQIAITETLYAGLQIVMPGEIAPAHRHSPSALRLVIEGNGAYTSVNGEKAYMQPGDFITTPSWRWHAHGNESKEPVIWLDILDMPLVRTLGVMFMEVQDEIDDSGPAPGDSHFRYGQNMRPVDKPVSTDSSPIISYGYHQARQALDELKTHSRLDNCHGLKMEYINPVSGGTALATISTFLQYLPEGFKGQSYRSTEGTVFTVIEGQGHIEVGEGDNTYQFEWREKDIFVVPCWYPYRLSSEKESFIFSASDRIVQTKLGIWREER